MPNFPTRQLVAKPSIAAITEYYQPPLCGVPEPPLPDRGREIFVLATACFQGVDPRVYDTHRVLVAQMAVDYRQNLWIVPVHERMPFPDAPLFSIAAMMNMERVGKVKADWFLWIEDDICVPKDTARILRGAADKDERPFVAAVGYDRNPPFPPAVWDWDGDSLVQWDTVPEAPLVQAGATGLTAALFHRSLFDRVKEPFFASGSSMLNLSGKDAQMFRGVKPDAWWSVRMKEAGIPTYIHTGLKITHLGSRLPINHETAALFRDFPGFERANFERTVRGGMAGTMDTGNGGVVSSSVRPGTSQGMDSRHAVVNGTRPAPASGESVDMGVSQAPAAPCAELPSAVRVEQSAELWRDWAPIKECQQA